MWEARLAGDHAQPGGRFSVPKKVKLPDAKSALLLVLLSLVLTASLGTVLTIKAGVLEGLLGTESICMLVPLVAAFLLARWSVVETLGLRWPGWGRMGLAALIGPAGAVLASGVIWLQSRVIPIPEAYIHVLDELMRATREQGVGVSVIAVSILPALAEEGMFRGVVLSALKERFGRPGSVFLSALLFGLIHVDPFRLAALTMVGALLGWVALTSRSILPAIVIHGMNNAMVLLPEAWLRGAGFDVSEVDSAPPLGWIVAAAAVVLGGTMTLKKMDVAKGGGRESETA